MARTKETHADTTDDTEVTEAKAEKSPKRQKHELPEGFGTPVDFTKVLLAQRKATVRPQVIFGHAKNSKTFQEFTAQHTDGRTILDLAAGLDWWDAKEARNVERAEKAAQKAE